MVSPCPADKVHVGAGNPAQGVLGEQQRTRICGTVGRQIVEPKRGHLLVAASSVLLQNVPLHRRGEVAHQEQVGDQIVHRAAATRASVERLLVDGSPLDEDSLFLLIGASARRPDANPDPALVSHRRQIGRQHLDHGHVSARRRALLNRDRGQGFKVDVRSQRREITQQPVGDGQTARVPRVVHATRRYPAAGDWESHWRTRRSLRRTCRCCSWTSSVPIGRTRRPPSRRSVRRRSASIVQPAPVDAPGYRATGCPRSAIVVSRQRSVAARSHARAMRRCRCSISSTPATTSTPSVTSERPATTVWRGCARPQRSRFW